MKILLVKLVFIIALGNPEIDCNTTHSSNSASANLDELQQIESLIRKKAGAEFNKNSKNSFELNGYNVFTEVTVRNYGPSTYEESFFDVNNPNHIYKMRLVKNTYGEIELAVLIHGEEGIENYHACFDEDGEMFEEDPWGQEENYTTEIFNVYKKYRDIYSKRVDALAQKSLD